MEHVGEGDQPVLGHHASCQRVAGPHEGQEGFGQQADARVDRRRFGQHADGERGLPAIQQRLPVGAVGVADREQAAGRLARHAFEQRGGQHGLGVFAECDGEDAVAGGGVEGGVDGEGLAQAVEHLGDRAGEGERQFGGFDAAGAAQEQLVVERGAQPRQRVGHRRLRQVQPLGGARDVAFARHRVEHPQQVEVEGREVRHSCG